MLKEMQDRNLRRWVEPFVGGGNMIDKVPSQYRRYGYDNNWHTIQSLRAIRDFAQDLPEACTEETYNKLKEQEYDPVSSWLRFVSSFGGKFDNGYARRGDKVRRSRKLPVLEGKLNAIKQQPLLQGVKLLWLDYKDLRVYDALIYCDPPYKGTTSYKNKEPFDHEHFFNWCRNMKEKGNSVFVSEYSAPEDFEEVWQGEVKTNFSSKRKEATQAVEKLFKV
jgi:DNA adenine methylase